MTNVLDEALARVRDIDPVLAATLTREVDALRDGRKFGLVFNRHLPESVRLPNHPVKRGVKVALRNPQAAIVNGRSAGRAAQAAKDTTWRVTKVEKADTGERVAWLAGPDGEIETQPRQVADLVVIREFGEPVYPGLKSVGRIDRGKKGDPTHLVINGENHHALQALQFTHRGKVDLIYIDPPYNTGNQGWIYNDKYVDVTKGDASSKWLSFMERRLLIAKELLKDTGVIIVAIGDDEHHRLRMLLDQVFGARNFLSDVVWQGRVKSDRRFTGGGADFMLFYAKSQQALIDTDVRWLEVKPGVDDLLGVAQRAFTAAIQEGQGPADAASTATQSLRSWIRSNKGRFAGGLLAYQTVDEHGKVYRQGPLDSPNPRPNLVFDVLHPATGQAVPTPSRGWRVSRDVMDEMIAADQVVWGKDHTTGIGRKLVLTSESADVPAPTFNADRDTSTKYLRDLLGEQRFPFPKPHEVLMRWFRMTAPKDAVVLDFFGGSGTTTEAVLRLNAEDGGARQSILVTNNELSAVDAKRLTKDGFVPGDPEWEARGVFEYVTRPRISTFVTGTRADGSTYSDGLAANVEFFELTYLDESRVSRAKEFQAVAPLLWMQAGATGERIDAESSDGYVIAGRYAVLHDEDAAADFTKAVAERSADESSEVLRHVYVVTDSPSHFEHVSSRLPAGVTAHQLYEAYLRNFEINVEAR